MRNSLAILWSSFLVAGVLEMLVFSAVQPSDIHGFGGVLSQMSPTGVYTLAFFSFWLIIAVGMAVAFALAGNPRGPDDAR